MLHYLLVDASLRICFASRCAMAETALWIKAAKLDQGTLGTLFSFESDGKKQPILFVGILTGKTSNNFYLHILHLLPGFCFKPSS